MTAIEKAAQRVVDIMQEQVGYREKASNANLDDKTANAGSNNYTKFAAYFDDLWNRGIKWYNTRKQGAEWCDMFFDWAQCQAWGYDMARRVVYQPMESAGAGCPYSANYYRSNGAWIARSGEPKPGDQIFFGPSGKETHTGGVVKVDASKVYTIEGNANNMVMERSYSRSDSNISGYGRPNYALVQLMFENPVPPILDDPEPKYITEEEATVLFDRLLMAKIGIQIKDIKDIPHESVKAVARVLLDLEAVDGGTPYAINPDDINLPYEIVRALVISARYTNKMINKLIDAINSEGADADV